MIKNRLSILLAERKLKITRVAKDTGISRNTITSTVQNDGKMIQLDTINVLCKYLNINPGDFFDYIPYDFEVNVFSPDLLYVNQNTDGFGNFSGFQLLPFNFDIFIDVVFSNKDIIQFEVQCFLYDSIEFEYYHTQVGYDEIVYGYTSNKKLELEMVVKDEFSEFENYYKGLKIGFKNDFQLDLSNKIKLMILEQLKEKGIADIKGRELNVEFISKYSSLNMESLLLPF